MAVTADGAWLGYCRLGQFRLGQPPTKYDRTPSFNIEVREPASAGVIGDLLAMPKNLTGGKVVDSANKAGTLSINIDASDPAATELTFGREILLIEHGRVRGVYVNRSLKQELK
ncbi:hypothetical protein M0R72_13100 [Candidatus Pacearchaeota archaeon]|jgi:hypothetical protein|nr:hypothetical protein [Candidatus Pacearchaeota archaeon]